MQSDKKKKKKKKTEKETLYPTEMKWTFKGKGNTNKLNNGPREGRREVLVQLFQAEVLAVLNETGTELGFSSLVSGLL